MDAFLAVFADEAASIPVGWGAASTDPYGSDLSCTDDCTPLFDEVSGIRVVAESAWRSITSDLGSIPDCEDTTISLVSLLRRAATPTEVARWAVLARNAILSGEDRIASVEVSTTQIDREHWKIEVHGIASTGTPFGLVGALTTAGAILKEILAS